MARLVISNRLEELDQVVLFLEWLKLHEMIDAGLQFQLNLILEEYITNLIKYGYADKEIHQITVEIEKTGDFIEMVVTDDAGPFDISDLPENSEIGLPLHERKIGGLGIHFIKTLADEVHYSTVNGKNRLLIRKKSAMASHQGNLEE